MANAIVGTGLILAVASVIGCRWESAPAFIWPNMGSNRFGDMIRFTADVLNGVPSIVIGIAVYSLIVVRQKHFSAFSGGVALGIMMIPTVARATEEMLLMVPNVIREAALRTWHSEVADDSFDLAAHRFGRRDYGLHAGFCARGRRDRSAAVHRVRQSVLEPEAESADRGAVVAGFHLCAFRPMTIGTSRPGRAH